MNFWPFRAKKNDAFRLAGISELARDVSKVDFDALTIHTGKGNKFSLDRQLVAKNLVENFSKGSEPQQLHAVRILEKMPLTEQNLSPFLAAMTSEYPTVRWEAMKYLRGRQGKETQSFATLVFNDPSQPTQVRQTALQILRQIPSERSTAVLKKALLDADPLVRAEARFPTLTYTSDPGHSPWAGVGGRAQAEKLAGKNKLVSGEEIPRRDLHAKENGTRAYLGPEWRPGMDWRDILKQEDALRDSVPPHEQLLGLYYDPASGFKAHRTGSVDGLAGKLRRVGIAGTEDFKDVAADLMWGVPQARCQAFEDLYNDLKQDLKDGYDIELAGHSLGGGLAQVLAYRLAIAKRSEGLKGTIRAVTDVGMGGIQAVEATVGPYNANVGFDLDIVNLRSENDAVSLLTPGIGPLRTLANEDGVLNSHFTATTERLAAGGVGLLNATVGHVATNSLFHAGIKVLPTALRVVGPVGQAVNRYVYLRQARTMLKAYEEAARFRQLKPNSAPSNFKPYARIIAQLKRDIAEDEKNPAHEWVRILAAGGGLALLAGQPEWDACHQTSDCQTVSVGCMTNAVNRNFAGEYTAWAREKGAELGCLTPEAEQRTLLQSVCRAGKCVLEAPSSK